MQCNGRKKRELKSVVKCNIGVWKESMHALCEKGTKCGDQVAFLIFFTKASTFNAVNKRVGTLIIMILFNVNSFLLSFFFCYFGQLFSFLGFLNEIFKWVVIFDKRNSVKVIHVKRLIPCTCLLLYWLKTNCRFIFEIFIYKTLQLEPLSYVMKNCVTEKRI